MPKPTKTVRFLFDYISSNAYLAWIELPKIAARYGAEIEPVPVLFAGLLEAHGQLGPAEVRPKAIWMARNNLRKAKLLGVPLEPPRHHPFNPLLALRVSSLPMADASRRALIGALFEAVWVRGLHVSDPATVAGLASEAGLDGTAIVAQAGEPAAKARLREQTDAAIASGVFGVPTMQVGAEIFWGYDDLPYLELHLAGKDPLDPAEIGEVDARDDGFGDAPALPEGAGRVKLEGGCRCGALRYRVDGDLGPVLNCHCAFCRRIHGAPFTTITLLSKGAIAWGAGSAEPTRWTTPAGNVRQFCGRCAAPIWNYSTQVDVASLVVASLPDADQPAAWAHVNTESKAPHLVIGDDLPQFAAWPSADRMRELARGRTDVWIPEELLRLL